MTLVLDASMALSWAFERAEAGQRDCSERALSLLETGSALVPVLWHTEVSNGLLVGERRKLITPAESQDFLARLDRLSIASDAAAPQIRRDLVMGIARQHGLTVYDACYLDLVMRVGGILATFDVPLASAAHAAGVAVFQ